MERRWLAVPATLATGTAGALIATFLHFPAAFLTGPAIAVTLAGLFGLPLSIPMPLRNICFVAIGMIIGSGVSPETLEAARHWPLSFIGLVVNLVIIMQAAWMLLIKVWRFDRKTALFAAIPGHLSYALSLASETSGGSLVTVGMIQSMRILSLTLLVPFSVAAMGLTPENVVLVRPVMGLAWLTGTLLVALAVGMVFLRLNMPAAFLMGGIAAAAASHLTGIASGVVPQWIVVPCFVILGSLIGTRFSNISLYVLRRALLAAMAVTALTFAISMISAIVVSELTGLDIKQMFLAYAPGGLETMIAIAVNLKIDPTFVAGHHVFRLLVLLVLIPLFLRRV